MGLVNAPPRSIGRECFMWARDVEIMMGCWLAMSPFIFGHPEAQTNWWVNDFVCAVLVIGIAGSSYSRRLRYMHLLQVAMAAWLIGYAYARGFGLGETPGAMQNWVCVGLLLAMFGVIPNFASSPPPGWQKWREAVEQDRGEDVKSGGQSPQTRPADNPVGEA